VRDFPVYSECILEWPTPLRVDSGEIGGSHVGEGVAQFSAKATEKFWLSDGKVKEIDQQLVSKSRSLDLPRSLACETAICIGLLITPNTECTSIREIIGIKIRILIGLMIKTRTRRY
jgi:hypothetical protein